MELNIKEITLLKSRKKTLDEILKCKANEKLLKLGKSCVETIESVDGSDKESKIYKRLTYTDKNHEIVVDSFDKTGPIYPWRVYYKEFDNNGNIVKDELYKYMPEDDPFFDVTSLRSLSHAKDIFDGQEDRILEKYGEDGLNFYKRYINIWDLPTIASGNQTPQHIIQDYIRGDINKDVAKERLGFDNWLGFESEDADFVLDNYDKFNEILQNMSINDNKGNVLTYQRQKINDVDINKRIEKTDNLSVASVRGDYRKVDSINEIKTESKDNKYAYDILTLHHRTDNIGKGVYSSEGWYDKITYPIGAKFERVLIDTDRKFILRLPYKT